MIRTDHQHFVITVGRARASASTLAGAERAKRQLLDDWFTGWSFKKPEAIIVGPRPGPAREN